MEMSRLSREGDTSCTPATPYTDPGSRERVREDENRWSPRQHPHHLPACRRSPVPHLGLSAMKEHRRCPGHLELLLWDLAERLEQPFPRKRPGRQLLALHTSNNATFLSLWAWAKTIHAQARSPLMSALTPKALVRGPANDGLGPTRRSARVAKESSGRLVSSAPITMPQRSPAWSRVAD